MTNGAIVSAGSKINSNSAAGDKEAPCRAREHEAAPLNTEHVARTFIMAAFSRQRVVPSKTCQQSLKCESGEVPR
ncbi:hypothetical protein EYF80_015138 [Liparis tanakae]|uniref:Uncharacterized protein n=1 Tax=Liparis tanakae TaxID=230148 RepID=A0A4Z2IA03_9TELE|nr:hypothetical protein EYF80_015138 [Liparis tanakae]